MFVMSRTRLSCPVRHRTVVDLFRRGVIVVTGMPAVLRQLARHRLVRVMTGVFRHALARGEGETARHGIMKRFVRVTSFR